MTFTTTTDRIREFMRYFYNDYGWFEAVTGVKASKWRDLERGKTKSATAEMIDELCRCWPEFAYWFVTGKTASPRGQVTPQDYLDLSYGTVRAFEGGSVRISRDASGKLSPDLGNLAIDDRRSQEYEISVASRILYFSAFANERDATALAPKFWEQFLKPLKCGEGIVIQDKQLKEWINQFHVNYQN